MPRDRPGGQPADVGRDLDIVAAEQARRQWEDVAARRPAVLFDQLRDEADRIAESATWAGILVEDGRPVEGLAVFDQAAAAMTRLIEDHDEASRVTAASFEHWVPC